MTTYTLTGIEFSADPLLGGSVTVTAIVGTFTAPDNITALEYVVDASYPSAFDDITITSLFYNLSLFGEIYDAQSAYILQATFGEIHWGGGNVSYILNFTHPVSGAVSTFQIGGDALPVMTTASDVFAFLGTVTNIVGVTSGPYAPSTPISFAGIPDIIAVEDDYIIGNNDPNTLRAGVGDDTVVGQDGDDRLLGAAGDDILEGGSGNDTLYGQSDDDTLYGENGDDRVIGGGGHDSLEGGTGNDTVFGQSGDDVLVGGGGHDLLIGGNGNDSAEGGNGNDTLYGQSGNDLMYGGEGDDYLHGSFHNDTLYGGEGNDTLNGGSREDLLQGDGGDDDISGVTGNDTLMGDSGNDTLRGGSGLDLLYGGVGADLLAGGNHSDMLYGGEGNDTVLGQSGHDTLSGGTGNDLLIGGTHSDTFVFNDGDERDHIKDFENNADTIQLDEALWGGGLTAQQVVDTYANVVGNHTIFNFGNGDVLIVRDITNEQVLVDDILIV